MAGDGPESGPKGPEHGPRAYDPLDYHDPTAGIGGAPAARSALGLRLVLALFGLVVCTAGAVAFAVIGQPVLSAIAAALAAIAVVDAVVVVRRLRIERGSSDVD
jgi:hypothetical protein